MRPETLVEEVEVEVEVQEEVVPEVASCAANWAILLATAETVGAVLATVTGIILMAVVAEAVVVGAAGLVQGLVHAHPGGSTAGPGLVIVRPERDTAGPDLVLPPKGDPVPSRPLPREIPAAVHPTNQKSAALLQQHPRIVVPRAKEAAPLRKIVPLLLVKEAVAAGEARQLPMPTTRQLIKPITKSPH